MGDERKKSLLLSLALAAAAAGAVWVVWRCLLACFAPFLAGLALASACKPVAGWLYRVNGAGRRRIACIVLLFFYLALGAGIWLLAVWLAGKAGVALQQLPAFYQAYWMPAARAVQQFAREILAFLPPQEAQQLSRWAGQLGGEMAALAADWSGQALVWAASAVKKAPLYLIALMFTLLSSVLISADYERVTAFLRAQLPPAWRPWLRESWRFACDILPRLLRAYGILLAMTFGVLLVGLWLLGFAHAPWLAAGAALFDILPLLGLGGVLLPWSAALFLAGNSAQGAGLLALYALATLLRNLAEPRVVSGQTGLHPLATLTAMYAGLRLGGFLGMLAAPVLVMYLLHLQQAGLLHLVRPVQP